MVQAKVRVLLSEQHQWSAGNSANKSQVQANLGLEPSDPRVKPPARNGNRRAARPAAQPARWADIQRIRVTE